METDPLNVLIKSHDFVSGIKSFRKEVKKHKPPEGFYIEYQDKVISCTRFPYKRRTATQPFKSFEEAEKWGLWNFKGTHDNWRVVHVGFLGTVIWETGELKT